MRWGVAGLGGGEREASIGQIERLRRGEARGVAGRGGGCGTCLVRGWRGRRGGDTLYTTLLMAHRVDIKS